MKIIAVTACMSGVAHTYMAAELLEKYGRQKDIKMIVETQGALGIENALSDEQIQSADIVIIIADINIEGAERFKSTRQIHANTSTFLCDPKLVFSLLYKVYGLPANSVIHV